MRSLFARQTRARHVILRADDSLFGKVAAKIRRAEPVPGFDPRERA
jgi:hypothetical protein